MLKLMVILLQRKKEANSADTIWMHFGCYILTKHHKSILCTPGVLLDNIHIGAAHFNSLKYENSKYCDPSNRKAEAHQTTNTHKFTNTTSS